MSNVQQIDTLSKTVWHYTKMNVLEKIFPPKENEKCKKNKLEEKECPKIKLRFTNCRFLNDPSEALVLRKLLLENEEKVIERYNIDGLWDHYTFSMSHLKDSFAFWNKEYAGIDGIAIGFNADKFKEEIKNLENEIELQPAVFNDVCYVDYNEPIENIHKSATLRYEEIIEKFDKMFNLTTDKSISNKSESLRHLLARFSGIYKFTSWEHEKEVRAVLRDCDEERIASKNSCGEEIDEKENLNAKIEFIGNKIIKYCYKSFDKDIVNSIILGPDCSEEYVKMVEEYLKTNEYYDIYVSKSKAFDLRYKD